MLRRTFLGMLGLTVSHGVWGDGGADLAASDPPSSELSVDKHGLIVQTNGDGGDTAQREGWAWFGSWIREHELNDPWSVRRSITFQQTMSFLEIDHSGIFRRHPDQYNEPQDFSRDQTIPIVAAMGLWGDTARLDRFWAKTVARNYTTQNGEMLKPEGVNLFDRARGVKPGPIGDLLLFGGVLTRLSQATNPNDVGDDLNLIVMLLISKLRFPATNSGIPGTSIDDAISKYKTRPLSYGSYLQSYRRKYGIDKNASDAEVFRRMNDGIPGWAPDPGCSSALGALRWYFRAETNGNPELAELYAPIVKRWLT